MRQLNRWAFLLLTSVAWGAAQGATGTPCLSGEKDVRALRADIVSVELRGKLGAIIKQNAEPALALQVPDKVGRYVQCTVEGSHLTVDLSDDAPAFDQPVQLNLQLANLERLDVRGEYLVQVSGFRGKEVQLANRGNGGLDFSGAYDHVNASTHGNGYVLIEVPAAQKIDLLARGTGRIAARGAARKLSVLQRGTGNISTDKLLASDVDLESRGTGDASIYAADSVVINSRGTGRVEVLGKPVKRKVVHSGTGGIAWQ